MKNEASAPEQSTPAPAVPAAQKLPLSFAKAAAAAASNASETSKEVSVSA